MEQGRGVVCLAGDGVAYKPRLLREKSDLSAVPGSVYHSVSFTGAIGLLRDAPGPVLLVALPCQLAGIRKFIHSEEPAIREKIALTVGLVCGRSFSEHAPKAFMTYKGISHSLGSLRYRGDGKVGTIRIPSSSGGEHVFPRKDFAEEKERIDYRAAFSQAVYRLRCRVCRDHMNLLGDVVFGDAWLSRCREEKESLIIARTPKGVRAIEDLTAAGSLTAGAGSVEDLVESQSRALVYGGAARQYRASLAAKGTRGTIFAFSDEDPARDAEDPGASRDLGRELFLRRVVRRGHYRLYRFLYTVASYGTPLALARVCAGRVKGALWKSSSQA